MNNYWAKSEPKETIQEHTNKLIKNYEIFKSIYPNLNLNYELLKLACIYHDLGKMNLKFQSKIERKIQGKKHVSKDRNEIPHGILSLPFINYEYLEDKGFTETEIKILFQAIAYHHERDMDFSNKELKEEIRSIKKESENFKYSILEDFYIIHDEIEPQFFLIKERIYEENEIHAQSSDEGIDVFYQYIKVKGLLNRLDYAASGDIPVEIENNFLIDKLEEYREKENWNDWNELQKFMADNQNNNVVVVAQTGMGKTEGGLIWIGDNKGFFTLPLKTAINEIYNRVSEKIIRDKNKIGLLHSDALNKYIEDSKNKEKTIDYEFDDVFEHYSKTKQLSLPITICTLDQLFDVVFRYRGFEVKLATLAYSKVVIDEVQMYSPDLLACLVIGLKYITKIGGKFAILTATLPGIIKTFFKSEKIEYIEPDKPFIDDEVIRHSIKIQDEEINAKFIKEKFNNKVLVICNTVKKAKEIFLELRKLDIKANINLIHSKFTKMDRKTKENKIFEFGQKENKECGIWVATQVVEASLDIDFDILITELSDINGLLQRMGRCYRKRLFEGSGYNCYVFNGGDKMCSGIGKVVDKDIFNFSKEAINKYNGKIKESEKLNLIGEVYSTEKLKNTNYYKQLKNNIDYIKSIYEYEKRKKDISFRNIDSVTILAKCIYDENKENINNLINAYKDKDTVKEAKQEYWNNIQEYLINVPSYELPKKEWDKIELSKHKKILIYHEFDYDKEIGLSRQKKAHWSEEDDVCI